MADSTLLYDADTGEYFRPEDLDPSQYEVVGDTPQQEQDSPGFFDYAKAATVGPLAQIGKSTAGLIRAGEDYLGIENGWGAETVGMANNLLQDLKTNIGADPGSTSEMVFDVGTQAVPAIGSLGLAPMAGASALTAALGTQALDNFGKRYSDFRDQGAEPLAATGGAATDTAINSAFNLLDVPRMFKGTSLPRKILESAGINLATAVPQTAASLLVENQTTGRTFTPEEYQSATGNALKASLLQAPLMGAAGHFATNRLGAQADVASKVQSEDMMSKMATLAQEAPALPPGEAKIYGDEFIANDPTLAQQQASQAMDATIPPKAPFQEPPAILSPGQVKAKDPLLDIEVTPETGIVLETSGARTPEFDAEQRRTLMEVQHGALGQAPELDITKSPPSEVIAPFTSKGSVKKSLTPEENKVVQGILTQQQKNTDLAQQQAREEFPKSPVLEVDKTNLDKGQVREEVRKRTARERQRGAFRPFALFTKDVEADIDAAAEKAVRPGKVVNKRNSDASRFFRGEIDVPLTDITIDNVPTRQAAALYRQKFTFPRTLAQKFPEFSPFVDTMSAKLRNEHKVAQGVFTELTPYYSLTPKSQGRVNDALIAHMELSDKGVVFDGNDANLAKLGLIPEEIQAYKSVRNGLDLAWKTAEQAALVRASGIQNPEEKLNTMMAIRESFSDMKRKNYIPRSRFGEYYTKAILPDGKPYFAMFESRAQQKADAQKLASQGVDVEAGVLDRATTRGLDIPPDLLAQFSKFDPQAKDFVSRGFSQHFEQAKGVQGFSKDIGRNIADYVSSLARWSAKQVAQPEIDAAFSNLTPNTDLYNYAQRYVAYNFGNDPELAGVKSFLANYYLGTNVKSAALNLTQTITMTAPIVSKYVGVTNTTQLMARSYKTATDFLLDPVRFTEKNPTLGRLMDRAVLEGGIAAQAHRELSGRAQGNSGKSISDITMLPFDLGEKFNRASTFAAGLEIALKKGLSEEAAYKFADTLVLETQGDYSKANRPEIARGRLAPLFTFRLFAGNWLRLLRNQLEPGSYKAAAGMLASMTTLAGATGLPLIKYLIQGMEANGENPKEEARKIVGNGKFGDAVLYGAPAAVGINMSGSVGMSELTPDFEQGPLAALAKTTFGVMADLPMRAAKARWLFNEMDQPGRALETLMPEGVKNLMKAKRFREEGMRTPKNVPLTDPFGWYDTALTAMGFNTTTATKANEKSNIQEVAKNQSKKNDNINFKIALAKYNGDIEREMELRDSVKAKNSASYDYQQVKVNEAQVKKYLDSMKGSGVDTSAPKKVRKKLEEIDQLFQEN